MKNSENVRIDLDFGIVERRDKNEKKFYHSRITRLQ
jgi:hypothetical protein